MKRMKWRGLALGLITSTLGLGIAACDDDTSSTPPDLSTAGGDMSGAVDDMATGTPGTGQIVLADVVGTVFSPALPGGAAPRTHSMVAIASFPKTTPPSDPSSDLDLVMQKGCTINRFTATNPPHADGDAGNITITGYNPMAIATNTKTGSTAAVPLPPITCARSGPPLPLYTCTFGGSFNTDGGAMGSKTDDVIFPMIPYNIVDHATHGTVVKINIPPPQGWPFGDGLCNKRYVPRDVSTDFEMCEQSPILGSGVAQITESIAGGADYMAASKMLGDKSGVGMDGGGSSQFPGPVYVISVKSGTTEIVATDPVQLGNSLSMANGAIDPTKDLTIDYSCDPNNLTKGAACTGSTDLAAVLIKTSTSPKTAFATSTASGVGQCIARVTVGSVTVKAAQLTAALGGQTGGSIQLALARVSLQPAVVGGHTIAFTAGMGVFGFTNQ
jgi:hypothetical protein